MTSEPRSRVPTGEPSGEPPRSPLIVGIGASAGGLEVLEQFLSHVPAASGIAFAVIQHLDPHRASMLTELLGRSTKMPVVEVRDGVRAEADHVYVIAPGTILGMAGGSFRVTAADADRHGSIDAFLKALADDQGERAAGIILSGSGSDGTSGLRAIRERGGLTLAQSPETAKHDSMPSSAIEAGVVDHILPVEGMPAKLVDHARQLSERRRGGEGLPSDDQIAQSLGRICEILQRRTNHDFSHYKHGTMVRRLRRRVQLRSIASVDEYIALLEKEPQEPELLVKDLLIGVTHFFRDPEAFEYIARHALPRILARKSAAESVRVWVPGCASGEEAYSIAMLIRELLSGVASAPHVQIFATDIDTEALAEARRGIYSAEITEHLSPERLVRFFTRVGSDYQIAKELREMCIFSQHSLIRDPPFSALDLVSCRNVLIYLDAGLQKKLVPVFHYALNPEGYLFLGPSEGLAGYPELFETIDKRHRVFVRAEPVTRPPLDLPLVSRPAPRATQPIAQAPAPTEQQGAYAAFERLMLQEYTPAGAVVNTRGDVLCVAGLTGRYLQPPVGILSTNILDIAHANLRVELRMALHAAVTGRKRVVRDDVEVEVEGAPRRLRLTVRPLPGVKQDGLFTVILQERTLGPEPETGEPREPRDTGADRPAMEQLESELRSTRADLRATVQDLESANEELKSSNEELLSTNEELQSSNEELQTSQEELKSVNEELETVNSELQRKVEELGGANSDLQNLFSSTDLATLFLDRELRVTRFTPAARALFRLINGDVGRPLSDLAQRFVGQDLATDAREVLRTLRPVERPVEALDGQSSYMLRVLPYRTVEDVIAGAVITLADVTQLKRAEADIRRLAIAIMDSNDAVTMQDLEGRIVEWNRGAERMYGYSRAEAVEMNIEALVPEEDRAQARGFLDAISRGEVVVSREVKRRAKDGRTLDVWLTTTKIVDGHGRTVGVATTERDVTERRRSVEALGESEERFRLLVERVKDYAMYMLAPDGTVSSWNEGAERLKGYRAEEIIGQPYSRFFPEEDVRAGLPQRELELAIAEGHAKYEGRRVRKDGSRFWASVTLSALRYEGGRLRGFATITRDITDRKRTEEALRAVAEQFRRAIEEAPIPVIMHAEDGEVLQISRSWTELTGYTREDMKSVDAWLNRAYGTGADAVRNRVRELFRGSARERSIDFPIRTRDGQVRHWSVSASSPGTLEDGRRFIVAMAVDVTDRERTDVALREAKERLEEANRRKDEFLAVLSHELRNPLAPIRNSLFILDRAAPGGEQSRRAHAVIDRQVGQLTLLIDDLLDVTRITRGKVQLQREPLELNELAQSTVEDHQSVFVNSKVQVEVRPAPAAVWVSGDRTRLSQVLGNLLQNAAKFTPRKGKTTVSVDADAARGEAVIRVRDTGVGIAPEIMPRLFNAFTQGDVTLDRSKGGLGLGLALAKGLVEMHGGSVRAESDGVGKGATFTITLPLATTTARAKEVPPSARGGSAPRRVLVIDDNVDAANSLREALELRGHVVEVSYSGPEGLESARAFRPDVVLCDIGLPGMDGYAVARALRGDPDLGRVPVIALTGYAQPEDVAKAREAGFNAHVAKPPSIEALEEALVQAGTRGKVSPPDPS